MYSLLPAVVSALFLGYGLYVIAERGLNRISTSFLLLCLTTFSWQAAWAVLFQVHDPATASLLVKAGYLLIMFLPTTLYQFLVEVSGRTAERRWVKASYCAAAALALIDLPTGLVVDGYHTYFFGFYPKAGPLHPIHVAQTVLVVSRGLFITFQEQRTATPGRQARLRLCIASLCIYFFAAIDYLCNYGFEFYPPGVVFIAISLGLMAIAVTRYQAMQPEAIAASMAHEMRTPLAGIRMQADALAESLQTLGNGYQLAVAHGLVADTGDESRALALSRGITQQVERSHAVIDMMLAAARQDRLDPGTFAVHSMAACVNEALRTYPFAHGQRERVTLSMLRDFEFFGSDTLMVLVLFNLLKNSLHAISAAGAGDITIVIKDAPGSRSLIFMDTGTGIAASDIPQLFETYFTTKTSGSGLGLSSCKRVLLAFGARIRCDSVEREFTRFTLEFDPATQQRRQVREEEMALAD